jgi:hypothetical protein
MAVSNRHFALAISKIGVYFLGNKKFAHGSVGDEKCEM